MTRPLSLAEFTRLPRKLRAQVVDGLATAIDRVAEAGPISHAFLRHQWYVAALTAYGGAARTLVVSAEETPVLTLPLVAVGHPALRLASVPGCYWPFRGFGLALDAGDEALDVALDALAKDVRALRIGPVYDGDPSATALVAAARVKGWTVIDRFVAERFTLDMAGQGEAWPRGSTLRKNRFHEKHLAAHGALDWRFIDSAGWPGGFDALAEVERVSWIADRTDGSDAKFTDTGHGAFWRAAAADQVLAKMMRAALLTVDGRPAAFSFDLDAGTLKYAIANSYDPQFAKHSPGKLLYYRNLVGAQARGMTEVDWGAGDSGYKQVIGATAAGGIRDWLFVRPGAMALVARVLSPLWRRRPPTHAAILRRG
jgi:CelD/BcsL family acetyltransferase involved in cellulose biosynthesis